MSTEELQEVSQRVDRSVATSLSVLCMATPAAVHLTPHEEQVWFHLVSLLVLGGISTFYLIWRVALFCTSQGGAS